MAPNINPAMTVSHVRVWPGLIVCASVSMIMLLNDRTNAPLYQTSAASILSVRIEVLNMGAV